MTPQASLAPYAANDATSRGRQHGEPPPNYRSEYQRDRDRIIHSAAFRRLEYKTQVFVNHEGDLYRTRLTHTLEVAQIARSIARALNLNEDLTEAIALAHDLGHTPFGHAGQEALNRCMKPFGGFEHNIQSLRIVDKLEEKYADFDGLNLTFETREGILKHCTRQRAGLLGTVAERFVHGGQPTLEAQLNNLADEIAYNNHDVDDGLRAELITIAQLSELTLFRDAYDIVRTQHPGLGGRRLIHEVIRRMIDRLASDLIETSTSLIAAARPTCLADIRAAQQPLIAFSDSTHQANVELKRFLRQNMYRHYRVRRMTTKAQRIIADLFMAFTQDPYLLPTDVHCKLTHSDSQQARMIADYIAGMTDRYAIDEHARVFNPEHHA
ncbi:deoxyguanosinetriphosphate triphosphohydrolase [Acidihalobacter ferrooxydans]|uniref:Deoxyguanosinetriphosphate triphosphohydrolase-like protein n=1 Tax=Acidihalobacter ferrooxydans TaxID=1765967 RepID=A0A1P8UKJ7_9GAMM|nr:deoxyguanosinetriphosphate triphosphohydrolase [Acidihalobacter ferrooxydans]APZ44324.1 deoxyguanosinetriphosphate triphosphohydrolase [Acidihalobacter ferrooxydans]